MQRAAQNAKTNTMKTEKTADEARLDDIFDFVFEVFQHAQAKHPKPYNSDKEGWAVIQHELDELYDEIRAHEGYGEAAFLEAAQVAGTAIRYIFDLQKRKNDN